MTILLILTCVILVEIIIAIGIASWVSYKGH